MEFLLLGLFLFLAIFWAMPLFATLLGFVVALVIWMIAGNIAGQIIRGRDYGVIGNIALGLAGGIVGTWLLRVIGFAGVTHLPILGAIISGVVGAVAIVFLVRLVVDSKFAR
jgi:uncharacterized membrane protein YeaQ/YmgE (transglycosylase-associated protein family)